MTYVRDPRVDAYIDGVAHDEVVDIRWSSDRVHYRRIQGDRVALPPPGEQRSDDFAMVRPSIAYQRTRGSRHAHRPQ